MIIMLFMAITSTGSAEHAVASLWSYDVYRRYINPAATGAQILMQSRIMVCVWAVCMFFSIILNAMGLCSAGSTPWAPRSPGRRPRRGRHPGRASAPAAILAAWCGMICAVIAWLSVAASEGGNISTDSTASSTPSSRATASPSARRRSSSSSSPSCRRTTTGTS